MMSRQELKKNAKEVAFSNLGKFWIAFIIVVIVGAIFEGIGEAAFPKNQVVSYALAGLIGWLTLGYNKNILSISRGEAFTVSDMLGYIKYFFQAFIYTLVHSVATAIIGGTFVVIGIILMAITAPFLSLFSSIFLVIASIVGIMFVVRLAMAYLIIADSPTKDPINVLKESNNMMKGHINEFLMLQLSFIGWWLLVIFTFGIALIWVLPYVAVAAAMYYDELNKLNNPISYNEPVQPVTFVEPNVQATQPVQFVEPTVQPVTFVEPTVAPVDEPTTPVNDPTNPII